MYDRTVDERELVFHVSGKLWQYSLVLKDQQTGSLWSQILGKCMEGELLGKQLKMYPSVITDWQTWRMKYPDSTVSSLNILSLAYKREYYSKNPKRLLIGMAAGAHRAKAWAFDQLLKEPVVNDEFGDRPLVIFFNPVAGSAKIFDPRLDDQLLEFEYREGQIFDVQTGSTWDDVSGTAREGPLAGKRLKSKLGIVSFRRAWDAFYRSCEYWESDLDSPLPGQPQAPSAGGPDSSAGEPPDE